MRMLRLLNGAEEPEPTVMTTLTNLDAVLEDYPGAFRELVAKARDDGHRLSDASKGVLLGLGLLHPGGRLHASTRNVVLSAVTGEGEGLVVGNPLAEDLRG